MTTLSLATGHATLDELEASFAPRVRGDAVFLPAPCDAPVGERVVVEVALAGGDVALRFEGHVSWRYPPGAVPPGREAGVGVVVEEASGEARALLERFRRREGAGTLAYEPGSRLAERTREAGWLRTPRVVSVTPAVRPLPSPPPVDDTRPPRPPLVGAFFVYADDHGRAGAVKHLERFSWPETGTQRPSETDSRFRPPGDTDDDGPSPWDEITDGQRAAPRWEESDPSLRVTDVVNRALDEMADVDRALRDSPRAPPPPPPADEPDERPPSGPTGTLPASLRLRVDDGRVEPLFSAGATVPASRSVTLSPSNGHPSVKVAVFEGDEGHGRHLGTVHVRVPSGEEATSVRVDVGPDGFVEVRSLDDGSVAERWRTSWAEPTHHPRAEKRRGWRRWLWW